MMHRTQRVLAGLVTAVLLAACAAAPPVQPFRAGPTPGELVHNDSGFTFPPRIGSFLRVEGHQYDAEGRDVSVGYNGDIPVAVTVYVYPAGKRTLEADLVQQSASVLAAYPGAALVGQRTVQVTPEGIDARSVSFSFTARFFDKEQVLHSELVLARHDDRFIKYRITYPESLADLGAEDSDKFLHHFAWP